VSSTFAHMLIVDVGFLPLWGNAVDTVIEHQYEQFTSSANEDPTHSVISCFIDVINTHHLHRQLMHIL